MEIVASGRNGAKSTRTIPYLEEIVFMVQKKKLYLWCKRRNCIYDTKEEIVFMTQKIVFMVQKNKLYLL